MRSHFVCIAFVVGCSSVDVRWICTVKCLVFVHFSYIYRKYDCCMDENAECTVDLMAMGVDDIKCER